MSSEVYLQKIWSSRVNGANANVFVGEAGRLFYDQNTPLIRLSDGVTPGGIIVAGGNANVSAGPQGYQGVAGAQGPQGVIGVAGPQGTQGNQGNQGASSAVIPSVDYSQVFLLMGA